jgi:hypothetical protein
MFRFPFSFERSWVQNLTNNKIFLVSFVFLKKWHKKTLICLCPAGRRWTSVHTLLYCIVLHCALHYCQWPHCIALHCITVLYCIVSDTDWTYVRRMFALNVGSVTFNTAAIVRNAGTFNMYFFFFSFFCWDSAMDADNTWLSIELELNWNNWNLSVHPHIRTYRQENNWNLSVHPVTFLQLVYHFSPHFHSFIFIEITVLSSGWLFPE